LLLFEQVYYFKNYPIVTTIDPINYVPITTTDPGPPPPDTTSFIYSFVYAGAPIDVLTRIPVITTGTGGGTLTISSSFTQVGTTYTITVSLISFTDSMFSGATVFNNGQAAGGTTAPLGWLTTGVTLPIATFRTGSALSNANNVNSANDQIGGAV